MPYYVYFIIYILIVNISDCTPIFELQQNEATYDDSKANCEAQNMSLPTPNLLYKYSNTTDIWMPVRRIQLPRWSWLNNIPYYDKISRSPKHQDCAQIRSADRFLDVSNCFSKSYGYLCLNNSTGGCKGSECVIIGNKTISIHREQVNWFQARDSCRNMFGSDLAVFPKHSINTVIDRLKQDLKSPGHFWIGLIRSKWMIDLSSDQSSEQMELQIYNWNTSRTDASHDCAIYSGGFWATSHCSVNHSYVCVAEYSFSLVKKPGTGRNETTITNKKISDSGPGFAMIIGLAIGGLLLIILVVVAGIFVCKRRRKKHKENIDTKSGMTANSEKTDNISDKGKLSAEEPLLSEKKTKERKSCTLPNMGKTIQDVPPPKPKRTYKHDQQNNDVKATEEELHGYINLDEFNPNKASDAVTQNV